MEPIKPGHQILTAMQSDFAQGTEQRWTTHPSAALHELGIEPSPALIDSIPAFYAAAETLYTTIAAIGRGPAR